MNSEKNSQNTSRPVWIYRRVGREVDRWKLVDVQRQVGGDFVRGLRAVVGEDASVHIIENNPTWGDFWNVESQTVDSGMYLTRRSKLES